MVWIGALIVILTFVAIIRQYETRMVLFISGLAMCLVGLGGLKGFEGAMDAFTKAMVNPGLVTVICTVMGFAFVMKLTRNTNPDLWRSLEGLGVGRLLIQSAREREFANIYRVDDTARNLDDEEFAEVLAFTRAAFEMAMAFRGRSPKTKA